MEICREEIGPDAQRMDPIHVQRRRCSRSRSRASDGHGGSDRVTILEDEEEVVVKSWVYFAQFGTDGPIKIGYANDPLQRVRNFTSGSPVPISLLGVVLSVRGKEEEAKIHKRLRKAHIRGEWFEAEAALREMRRLKGRVIAPEMLKGNKALSLLNTSFVQFRARARELIAWKKAAKLANESLSAWVRKMLGRHARDRR